MAEFEPMKCDDCEQVAYYTNWPGLQTVLCPTCYDKRTRMGQPV